MAVCRRLVLFSFRLKSIHKLREVLIDCWQLLFSKNVAVYFYAIRKVVAGETHALPAGQHLQIRRDVWLFVSVHALAFYATRIVVGK